MSGLLREFPILEFSTEKEAVIEPSKVVEKMKDIPKACIICFFNDEIIKLYEKGEIELFHQLKSETGYHPLYVLGEGSNRVLLFHPSIGAPFVVGMMEEIIALGVEKFIAIGGAGVLDQSLVVGSLMVVECAIRDEGTSYHYLKPSREVLSNPKVVNQICKTLDEKELPYIVGKTWTTDAFFRETREKVALRKQEGCLMVEMEAAAMIAVSQFRNVSFGQILYSGDNLDGAKWDSRQWQSRTEVRKNLILLAQEILVTL